MLPRGQPGRGRLAQASRRLSRQAVRTDATGTRVNGHVSASRRPIRGSRSALPVSAAALTACGGSSRPTTPQAPKPAALSTPSRAVPSTTTTPPVMSASSVTQFVTTFYSDYFACLRTNDASTCATGLVRENGTPNLESHYTPAPGYAYQADPITCAQNYPPAVHVSGVTTTPTRASGTVTEDFARPITTGFVVVDQSGMLKIDAVTCTPPMEAVAEPTAPTDRPLTTTADFLTPTANISCEINYQRSGVADGTYCQTLSPPQSATMSTDGTYTTCTGPNCVGNPGVGTPTLAYGDTAQVGPFSCVSAVSGVTCTVAGRGFTIARSGIAPAGASAPSVTATTMSALAGTWRAHETTLVINKAGTGDMSYQDLSLCPSCSPVNAPTSTLVFVLTSLAQGVATGDVTATSDPKNTAMGAPVQVSLTAGSPGQILKVVIGGTPLFGFCNSTSVGQCGA